MSTVGSEYTDAEIREQLQNSEIAGGSTYVSQLPDSETPQRSNADFIVSSPATTSDFYNATNQANDISGGGLVWVDGDVTININSPGTISNCTIASDRGQSGSDGALLFCDVAGPDSPAYSNLLTFGDNARLFGVRMRGPTHDYWDSEYHPGYIPFRFDELGPSERDEFRDSLQSRAIHCLGDGIEIENCKIWGWSTNGIRVGDHDENDYYEPHIHHCDIHDNMQSGLGYNISMTRGNALVQYCYFNASRHTIATFGYWNSGYRIEDSIIGPSTSLFLLDTHSLEENSASGSTDRYDRGFIGRASGNVQIRRVTFTPETVIDDADYDAGLHTSHASFGGEAWPPDGTGIIIENCRCTHDSMNDAFHQTTSGDGWSVPTDTDGFAENTTIQNNQYGAPDTPYDANYGAPLNIRGETPTQTADLRVHAQDEDGNPITGATITVERQSGSGS